MHLLEPIIEAVEQWRKEIQRLETKQPASQPQLAQQEEMARQLGKRVAQLALCSMIEESGTGYQGASFLCACGARLHYQRDQVRSVRTLVGEISYKRAYYYCRDCGASSCPKDVALGQSGRDISAGVERQIALLGAHLSFATSAEILQEVGGVDLSGRQCETVAEAVGAEAEARTKEEVEQSRRKELRPAVRLVGSTNQSKARQVWVVEMDGVQAPLKGGRWQEVKCGVVYELGQRVEISRERWELLGRERCCVRGSAEEFRERLWATLRRAGVRIDDAIVVLGDGAEWIDQTVEELFVEARRVLDFYHVAERVWAVAGARLW